MLLGAPGITTSSNKLLVARAVRFISVLFVHFFVLRCHSHRTPGRLRHFSVTARSSGRLESVWAVTGRVKNPCEALVTTSKALVSNSFLLLLVRHLLLEAMHLLLLASC